MRILKAVTGALNTCIEYITAAMLAVMTLVVLFQVICRSLGTGLDWTEELARYLLVSIVLLGTGIGVYRGGNIGIEALINAVSPAWRRILTIVMNLCCLLLFGEMIRYGLRVLRIAGRQTSPIMQIPMTIPYGIIFVGVTIIFIHLLVQLLNQIFPGKIQDN